jgi:hypothetical protein
MQKRHLQGDDPLYLPANRSFGFLVQVDRTASYGYLLETASKLFVNSSHKQLLSYVTVWDGWTVTDQT